MYIIKTMLGAYICFALQNDGKWSWPYEESNDITRATKFKNLKEARRRARHVSIHTARALQVCTDKQLSVIEKINRHAKH